MLYIYISICVIYTPYRRALHTTLNVLAFLIGHSRGSRSVRRGYMVHVDPRYLKC